MSFVDNSPWKEKDKQLILALVASSKQGGTLTAIPQNIYEEILSFIIKTR